MEEYILFVQQEIDKWEKDLLKKSSLFNRISKQTQNKVNTWIPDKVHTVISESVKNMVKATLVGSNMTTARPPKEKQSLFHCDQLLKEKLTTYRKTAIVEGAGTGAGGILLGLADFPLLLSIKMKFLFEAARTYGFDTKQYEERLFLLLIFQLAFSSDEKRHETFHLLKNWETEKDQLTDIDWHVFQQEYRDHIDLVKLFQLVPGFGAIVGAYANHNLLEQLGKTAMNVYRMRVLSMPRQI